MIEQFQSEPTTELAPSSQMTAADRVKEAERRLAEAKAEADAAAEADTERKPTLADELNRLAETSPAIANLLWRLSTYIEKFGAHS